MPITVVENNPYWPWTSNAVEAWWLNGGGTWGSDYASRANSSHRGSSRWFWMWPKASRQWTLRSGTNSSRGMLHTRFYGLLLHLHVLSRVLAILSHHPTTILAWGKWHHGSESGNPFLKVGIGGIHLLLPLLPLAFIVLQLVFVGIGLELLMPQDEGAIPVLE